MEIAFSAANGLRIAGCMPILVFPFALGASANQKAKAAFRAWYFIRETTKRATDAREDSMSEAERFEISDLLARREGRKWRRERVPRAVPSAQP